MNVFQIAVPIQNGLKVQEYANAKMDMSTFLEFVEFAQKIKSMILGSNAVLGMYLNVKKMKSMTPYQRNVFVQSDITK